MPISSCLVAAAILCWSVAANGATLGGGGDPRALDPSQKLDPGTDPATLSGNYVATQAEGKLKGVKRIAITNMCVQFVNSKSASGFSKGATRAYTRTSEGSIPGGLDEIRMQAVADGWLNQIEADLKAAGYEVVPYEQLAGNELFQKFSAKYDQGIRVGARSDTNNSKGDVGETLVYVSPKGRPFATDCGTISPASTSTFVRMAYPLDTDFLTISAVIDMGSAKSSGGLLRGARAEVDFLQHVRAGDTQFQFVGKSGPGARIWLKQSVIPRQDPFSTSGDRQVERSGAYDAVTGTTTMTTSTSQSVAFDEGLYYDNAARYLNIVHRMFLHRMAAK